MKASDFRAEIGLIPTAKTYGDRCYVDRRAVMDLVPREGIVLSGEQLGELLFYLNRGHHDKYCPAAEWNGPQPTCKCGDDHDRAGLRVMLGVE